jgi:hypothetical protein
MDAPNSANLVISDHCLLSDDACWLCMELGDDRKSRSVCDGRLSRHRGTTSNLDVSECSRIRHRLALGEIGRSHYTCFRVSNAFTASNSKTCYSRFLSLRDPLSFGGGDCYSWNTILGVLVAIEKDSSLLERCPTNRWSPGRTPGSSQAHRPDVLREDERSSSDPRFSRFFARVDVLSKLKAGRSP